MPSAQVAVRLSDELLASLDWLVIRCDFDNRGEVLRSALEQLAQRERDRQIDEQIIAAYERQPRTDEERTPPSYGSWNALDDEDWSGW